jgi:phage tail-like protein
MARVNPYAAFNFLVSHENVQIGGFMEVSGLDGENAVIEYRQGDDQKEEASGAFVRKQPGLERYPNVTLRRGITDDLKLWTDLRKKIRDAAAGPSLIEKLNSTSPFLKVELQNEKHKTVVTWQLHNVWVSKLSGPSLNAKGNEIAIESIEVVCERIELVTAP